MTRIYSKSNTKFNIIKYSKPKKTLRHFSCKQGAEAYSGINSAGGGANPKCCNFSKHIGHKHINRESI